MITRARTFACAVTFLLLLASIAVAHADSWKIGFTINVQGDGFFLNPIVTKVLVSEVNKPSLAAAAGIIAGDEITQVDGQRLVGHRARDLEPLMQFNPGQTRVLRLKHASGEEFDARITKPKA